MLFDDTWSQSLLLNSSTLEIVQFEGWEDKTLHEYKSRFLKEEYSSSMWMKSSSIANVWE